MKAKFNFICIFIFFLIPVSIFPQNKFILEKFKHDLDFKELAVSWDEGMPLGNGMLGSLIWKKEGKLRFSLDRADLWDLRPMKNLDRPEYKFKWVIQQVLKNDYKIVQDLFDKPYEEQPAPTKIPAGALEFDISDFGEIDYNRLYIKNAVSEVKWKNGIRLLSFVHAKKPAGWFRFEKLPNKLKPEFIAPDYSPKTQDGDVNSVIGQDLGRLEYKMGIVLNKNGKIKYTQPGWNGFYYIISIEYKQNDDKLEGIWSISSHYPDKPETEKSDKITKKYFKSGFDKELKLHIEWWTKFYKQSAVSLPDEILERLWYLEKYKFGSAARQGAPPISLQAVWTADNGKIPPWKGDFHNDLNTQLSYWPCYSGNHLEEGLSYLDWLWNICNEAKKYTKDYFEVEGLNIPGVATLRGQAMGGWIQYSLSPTVSAWLAQHFYLHWRYSMDKIFLKERAYPFIKEVAIFLDNLSIKNDKNIRQLPISSSPEIDDNSIQAWHKQTTNFDLAMIRWIYKTATELAYELNLKKESEKWEKILSEWPELSISEKNGALCIAPGKNLEYSHRHFSHLMAIHPLGLINWENGNIDQKIITNSLKELEALGVDWWCGYSYSWLGNMYARAMNGKEAARALKIFAECFCLPNSFHANGDQTKTGKSKFTYRPFTLEGNFAFASGIQEMLLQSYNGLIKVFPAIPEEWKNISFDNLRAEGAFLISAKKENGTIKNIKIFSEKGGKIKLLNPFGSSLFKIEGAKHTHVGDIIQIDSKPNQEINLTH